MCWSNNNVNSTSDWFPSSAKRSSVFPHGGGSSLMWGSPGSADTSTFWNDTLRPWHSGCCRVEQQKHNWFLCHTTKNKTCVESDVEFSISLNALYVILDARALSIETKDICRALGKSSRVEKGESWRYIRICSFIDRRWAQRLLFNF